MDQSVSDTKEGNQVNDQNHSSYRRHIYPTPTNHQCQNKQEEKKTTKRKYTKKHDTDKNLKRGRWESWERKAFLKGLREHGKGNWKKIAKMIPTRTTIQVKTHAQVILKRMKSGEDVFALQDLESNCGRYSNDSKIGGEEIPQDEIDCGTVGTEQLSDVSCDSDIEEEERYDDSHTTRKIHPILSNNDMPPPSSVIIGNVCNQLILSSPIVSKEIRSSASILIDLKFTVKNGSQDVGGTPTRIESV